MVIENPQETKAYILQKRKRLEEAITRVTSCITNDNPSYSTVRSTLNLVYRELADETEKLKAFEQYINVKFDLDKDL